MYAEKILYTFWDIVSPSGYFQSDEIFQKNFTSNSSLHRKAGRIQSQTATLFYRVYFLYILLDGLFAVLPEQPAKRFFERFYITYLARSVFTQNVS
jgi:hypothetical protein